jgi:hypothetical protein
VVVAATAIGFGSNSLGRHRNRLDASGNTNMTGSIDEDGIGPIIPDGRCYCSGEPCSLGVGGCRANFRATDCYESATWGSCAENPEQLCRTDDECPSSGSCVIGQVGQCSIGSQPLCPNGSFGVVCHLDGRDPCNRRRDHCVPIAEFGEDG